ncbi:MAG: hypothetical protein HS126_37260 [Anaerolineales bacterium]|nr:hypothetical protein [Anaerolineales bacterium]
MTSIAFNSDRTSIVSAGCEIRNDNGYCELGTATVWNVEPELNFYGQSALEVARMVQAYFVDFITFSPDGRYILAGSNENAVRVWDAYTWLEITRLPHDSSVSSATL